MAIEVLRVVLKLYPDTSRPQLVQKIGDDHANRGKKNLKGLLIHEPTELESFYHLK